MITEFICNIEKVVYGGSGIGTYEGIKVFVPYSAPGDNLLVKINEKKRDYYIAEIKKILQPSPVRTNPPCQYFIRCGGCFLQHINYETQLDIKRTFVAESLKRIGHLAPFNSLKINPCSPFHHRNKTQYPLGSRPLKIGYYKSLTHKVIDIEECLLHPKVFDDIRKVIKENISGSKEKVYNEEKHTGNLRHIIFRQGQNTNEILVIFVTRTENLDENIYKNLPTQFNNIVGIVQNINTEKTNRIMGSKNKVLFGRDYYFENILDRKYKVSSSAFFQVNTFQTENIAKKLREYIGNANTVLDLYCGVGMLSIAINDLAKNIYGIELSKKAIQDAQDNIKLNNISNIEYISAPVEIGIRKYKNIDTIILDPPRKGCSQSVLHDIVKLKPEKIIYISCNPTTLARDLATLDNLGYKISELELFDMFPQTFHIESMVKIIPK